MKIFYKNPSPYKAVYFKAIFIQNPVNEDIHPDWYDKVMYLSHKL
jgi:hypothetical protein